MLENISYQQKKEIDALFNFVSTLEIKDNDEALKYETLETEKMGSIYLQACLGTDKFYTYTYNMEDVLEMVENELMKKYHKLFTKHIYFRDISFNDKIEDFKFQMANVIGYSDDTYKEKTLAVLYQECINTGKRIDVELIYYNILTKDRTLFGKFIEICEKIIEFAYRGLASNEYFYNVKTEGIHNYLNKEENNITNSDDYLIYDEFLEIYEEMRSFMSNKVITGMENGEFEQNNYYRVLNGKPEINCNYTFKISNLTSFKRSVLTIDEIPSLTYYDKMILIRDNPDIKFLQNILEPIPISESRLANDYYIIKYNSEYLGKTKTEKFISYYYDNLKMLLLKFHNSALVNQPLYKPFLRLFLIFITMQSYISTALEDFNNIDLFDQDRVTKMFRSYDLDYFSDLPIDYQKIILKNINTLIKYSGSNEIMVDIPNLFGLSNTTIYKYYLVKKTNAGETDPSKYYDLVFAKVPVEESNPISYLLDSSNYLDYDEVISSDPYWNKSKEEIINALNKDGQRKIDSFNYRLTKYISIISSVDLLKQTQDCNYVLHLIQSLEARAYKENRDLTKGTSLTFVNSTYKPSGNNRISLIDGFVALNWLILMRGNIDGISLSSDGTNTYGAYFAQKITELTENETNPDYKGFYTSYNVLDSNLAGNASYYNLENHNSIYRWEYEYLTTQPTSQDGGNETRLVYQHTKRDYDENGNIILNNVYELNRMNLLYAFKEYYNPSSDFVCETIRTFNQSDAQRSALSSDMKTYQGFIDYIKSCNGTNGRKYIIANDYDNENPYTFGSEENDIIVENLFNEYDAEEVLRESVDGLLLLYVNKFKAYDYSSTNNEHTLPDKFLDDYSKMDAFVALYKGFKEFKADFERLILSEENPLVYKFLKRTYYSCMVTEYQENCYPILEDGGEDKGRLSEYARYLKNKDEVFYSLLIDNINSLLPTDAGASDNIVYRQTYINGINEIILELIDSIKAYLNSSEFENLFNLSDTNTVDSIRFYIQQILEVFKSYTIFIHDVKIDYTFDDKFSEGVKVLIDLYSIRQKLTIIESTEFFGRENNRVPFVTKNYYDSKGNLLYTLYDKDNDETNYEYEGYDLYKIHKKPKYNENPLTVSDKYTYKTTYNHLLGDYMIRSSVDGKNNLPVYRLKVSPTDNKYKFYDIWTSDTTSLSNGLTPVEEETILPKAILDVTKEDYFLIVLLYSTKEEEYTDDNGLTQKRIVVDISSVYPGKIFFTEFLDDLKKEKEHIYPTNKVEYEDGLEPLSENMKVNIIGKIMKE